MTWWFAATPLPALLLSKSQRSRRVNKCSVTPVALQWATTCPRPWAPPWRERAQGFGQKLSSRKLPDGRMVTAPLEDMAPFLEREELRSNMLVPLAEE